LRADSNGVEETLTVTVVPKRSKDGKRVVIGIFLVPAIDFEHPVVAKTIAAEGGPAKLEIPRGASITAVDKTAVSNFYDVIREIRRYDGERITIDWRIDEKVAGDVALDVGEAEDFIALEPILRVPLEPLERLYKAGGPVDAIAIGYRKTSIIVVQTYLSIRRLIEGLVGQEELSGPVGIIAITYQIAAERPLIELLHFVGLISVLLAVFNLLPLPPFDGGWLVLLAVEKIKGSALSERVQEIIAYAGVMFILALFVYLTFNDILNIFFR
jgi:regulator of sigma E protease